MVVVEWYDMVMVLQLSKLLCEGWNEVKRSGIRNVKKVVP